MAYEIRTLDRQDYPALLTEIPDPPVRLYVRGTLPPDDVRHLTIVGSRAHTVYGKQAVEMLVDGLRGQPVSIVSGLALGIDSIAHQAALDAGLHTVAIPGSGLSDNVLYPARHRRLAHHILEAGGALLSEFEPTFQATPWCFAKRNRIVAGLSHATLIVEAKERSGTLITARLATDYNRDVLAIPGSIFSKNSAGPHMLIRLGATPITSVSDLLEALDLDVAPSAPALESYSADEQRVLGALTEPVERDALIRTLQMPVHEANTLLSLMELKGYIREYAGTITRLV